MERDRQQKSFAEGLEITINHMSDVQAQHQAYSRHDLISGLALPQGGRCVVCALYWISYGGRETLPTKAGGLGISPHEARPF